MNKVVKFYYYDLWLYYLLQNPESQWNLQPNNHGKDISQAGLSEMLDIFTML